jgi:hypothetical protein
MDHVQILMHIISYKIRSCQSELEPDDPPAGPVSGQTKIPGFVLHG